MPLYEVNIVYRGQKNYVVEANDPQEAEMKVEQDWAEGDDVNAVILGTESEDVEKIVVKEVPKS